MGSFSFTLPAEKDGNSGFSDNAQLNQAANGLTWDEIARQLANQGYSYGQNGTLLNSGGDAASSNTMPGFNLSDSGSLSGIYTPVFDGTKLAGLQGGRDPYTGNLIDLQPGGGGGVKASEHAQNDGWGAFLGALAMTALPVAGGMGAFGGADALANATAADGGFPIPSADELSAAGFGDGGGMGITGAGGIGSASSVAGSGAGAAGYGTTAAELGTEYPGEFGGDQGANEWKKLVGQNAAESDTLLPNGLPNIDTTGGGFLDTVKNFLTNPSNLAKIASTLKSGGSGGGVGGYGGASQGPQNEIANQTPGMLASPAVQQQQQLAQALLLNNPSQTFNPVQFAPMGKLAQALQGEA